MAINQALSGLIYFKSSVLYFTVTLATLCWRNLESYCEEAALGSDEGSHLTGRATLSGRQRISVLPGLALARDLLFCFPLHFTYVSPLSLFCSNPGFTMDSMYWTMLSPCSNFL